MNMTPSIAEKTPARPLRTIAYAPAETICERNADGGFLLRSGAPLAGYDPSLARLFRTAVARRPDQDFLAERDSTGAWRRLTYAEARRQVDAVAQALLDRGLDVDRPLMVLSGNTIEHAILMLAAFTAGVPIAPISVAYSLQSQDHAKLKFIANLLTPGLVYVADTAPFANALAALDLDNTTVVASRNGANRSGAVEFAELTRTKPTEMIERSVAATHAGTIAKILYTSGSTGFPKGVINTHGMLAANQQALWQIWPFLQDEELVLVDWLPWNHTFGGNHNFNLVLKHAGTLYIDAGKPVPELVKETVRNLTEISPTIYFNVPAGFATLLPHLEQNEVLARSFFARLRLIFYAGAALPQDIWERLEAAALSTTGERVPMTSSWGATETAPLATASHFLIDRAGVIGIPAPGIELKLLPSGSKLEVRVRGPHVTPGYWRQPELTEGAFDEEGFYRICDAVKFADAADPNAGLVFDGRIAEDFKLATGTWVNTGPLRIAAVAAASPVLQDAIVAGEGRDCVGLLAWVSAVGCQKLIGDSGSGSMTELVSDERVRTHVRRALARWNAEQGGSSTRIVRVLLLRDMPSIDDQSAGRAGAALCRYRATVRGATRPGCDRARLA